MAIYKYQFFCYSTGGTIDITAHQVLEDRNVRELIKATGGNWGGTCVDEEYMDFIKCLIGETATKEIEEKCSNVMFEACREFEMAKRTIKPNSDTKFNVRIPSELRETYRNVYPGNSLTSKTSVLTKTQNQICISFTGDKLRMASNDAERFFASSIMKITRHLQNLFQQNNERDITTIILVGGYAESAMLIDGMKTVFPEMRIIIPPEAAWSVLHGAVIFGHDPNLIKQRRSKYSYGIKVFQKFDPLKHEEKYKFEEAGKCRCRNIFNKIVEADEILTVGEYQEEKPFIMHSYGEKGNLNLYASVSKNPQYVTDKGCFFIGCILSSGHNFLLNESVFIKMRFGETEIEFNAYQPKSKKSAVYYLGQ